VSSAYLTYVAIDGQGSRIPVPQVLAETENQMRRHEDAARRREIREEETRRRKAVKAGLPAEWYS
jgi:acyl-CoA hydrolase